MNRRAVVSIAGLLAMFGCIVEPADRLQTQASPLAGGSRNAGNISYDNADSGLAATNVQAAIDESVAEQQAGDSTLQSNIDNEATVRGVADQTLNSNISTEAQLRAAADGVLRGQIDALADGGLVTCPGTNSGPDCATPE